MKHKCGLFSLLMADLYQLNIPVQPTQATSILRKLTLAPNFTRITTGYHSL